MYLHKSFHFRTHKQIEGVCFCLALLSWVLIGVGDQQLPGCIVMGLGLPGRTKLNSLHCLQQSKECCLFLSGLTMSHYPQHGLSSIGVTNFQCSLDTVQKGEHHYKVKLLIGGIH